MPRLSRWAGRRQRTKMETNTNTNTAAWPMRIELRAYHSADAARFGIDVNAENGDAVGWRIPCYRVIEIDSADDAADVADYIRREADAMADDDHPHTIAVRAKMLADADAIERASDREGDA